MASESDPNRLNTSLYVGDLHPFVNESVLKDFFNQIGPVKNARICRDTTSQQSLGYGYVNYKSHDNAASALENLNYEQIINRPCRIMWAQRDPNLRRSGKYNLFVKNLGKEVTQKQLYDSCELFGTILSAKIATDENGVSKGYGFVHFATEEAYNSAMEFLDRYQINGSKKRIYAGPFIPKTERKSLHDPSKFNNCFVKNFGEGLDDDGLRKMFEKYGNIISSVVMKDETGKSKGFGFVCFENPDSAMGACNDLNNTDIGGNTIYVGKAIRKEKRLEEVRMKQEKIREERKSKFSGSVNLYVKNLEPSFDDSDLHKAFCKFGEITSAKVMRNEDSKSRGFGFVCFKEAGSATKAVSEMKNSLVGTKPLYVAIAQRKEERQTKLLEVFRSKVDDINHMVPAVGYYSNPYSQGQRYYHGTVIQNRRGINPMMQHINAGQMPPSQFPGNQPSMPQYTHPYGNIRPQPGMNRSAIQGIPAMTQGGLASANMRGVGTRANNISGFNQNQQMGNRLVTSLNPQMRNSNPNTNANVQYNQNARNVTMPNLNDERKTRLGNRLMPVVSKYYPENASRLTGILLSMDGATLEKLIDDEAALKEQIEEANVRLRTHEENSKKTDVK